MAQDTPSLVAQVWTIQKTCRGASVESIYSETTVERGEPRRASRWPDRLLPFFLFPTIQCAHGSRETAGEKGCPKPCGWAGAACGFHLPLMWPMSYVYMEEYTERERERERLLEVHPPCWVHPGCSSPLALILSPSQPPTTSYYKADQHEPRLVTNTSLEKDGLGDLEGLRHDYVSGKGHPWASHTPTPLLCAKHEEQGRY